jgi:allantoinase
MEPRKYGPFPYAPITRRPKLTWPNGARLALWVIPNIEVFALDAKMPAGQGGSGGIIPDVHTWAIRDYGNRVGIFRMMEVLERHGIRATVALNSDACDAHPGMIADAVRLGWEFMGHNQTNVRRLNTMPPEKERDEIRGALERIARATGRPVAGWLGSGLQETWNTLDYLIELGCKYVADWVNDDQPYVMDLGGRQICSIPYSAEINDKSAVDHLHATPGEFEGMIRRQFDVLYREGAQSGRVMAIALHPYITGVPHRIDALDSALRYIASHDGVWLATGGEIIDHYLKEAKE